VQKKKKYVIKTFRENVEMSSEEEEEEEEYKKGGYHPVEIDDVLNTRYKITAKLGWGHFSTVWLAMDIKSEEDKPIALKIVKSAQHYTEAALDEIKILQKTTQEDPNNEYCVIRLLDNFQINGVNGDHVAMVFEKLGCNLLTLIRMYRYKGLPIPLVRIITKQVLIGVDFLHRCQIIHTDLKPENLLLVKTPTIIRNMKKDTSKNTDDKTTEKSNESGMESQYHSEIESGEGEDNLKMDMEKKVGEDNKSTNAKGTNYDKMMLDVFPPSLREGLPITQEEIIKTFSDCYKIKIVDLGNACWTFKHFTDDVQTRQYRAPEVILGAKYDTPIDIWSVASIVFELLTGDLLFEPKTGKNFEKNDDHLAQMQELLGKMPRTVTQTGKYTRNFFNRKGELRFIKNLRFWPLKDVLKEKYKFPENEAHEITDFLLPMLTMIPRERATARVMLNHPWIKDIDINDFNSCFK
jgi:serine/threonine-protein kinase SRPK3